MCIVATCQLANFLLDMLLVKKMAKSIVLNYDLWPAKYPLCTAEFFLPPTVVLQPKNRYFTF